jgi:methionyl-tRNA synthetase
MTPQAYVDKYSQRFKDFHSLANISYDRFIRTTDEKHILAAQKMWQKCFDNGDIYKKNYKTKYCVGCELEKTDSELVDGKCVDHPTKIIEERDEENYFFRFSNYEGKLLELYNKKNENKDDDAIEKSEIKNILKNNSFVIPDSRQNEVAAFVKNGLQDFSISRLKAKMPWGVDVPGDSEHVMYVWFDALTSYISTLGWGYNESSSGYNDFIKYWEQNENKRQVVQYCGKDNNRQQSAMWQAMLMSAGILSSTNIIINGFIQSGGQKMSKSTGNVISPFEVIEHFKEVTDYPEDVLRFVLLHDVSSFEDSDVTMESIKQSYTANLSNGIGNLTSRIMKMAVTYDVKIDKKENFIFNAEYDNLWKNYNESIEKYDLNIALKNIIVAAKWIDVKIQQEEPFKLIKTNPEEAKKTVQICMQDLFMIAEKLQPFMPRTSDAIMDCIINHKSPERPIFNRLN